MYASSGRLLRTCCLPADVGRNQRGRAAPKDDREVPRVHACSIGNAFLATFRQRFPPPAGNGCQLRRTPDRRRHGCPRDRAAGARPESSGTRSSGRCMCTPRWRATLRRGFGGRVPAPASLPPGPSLAEPRAHGRQCHCQGGTSYSRRMSDNTGICVEGHAHVGCRRGEIVLKSTYPMAH